MSIPIVLPMPEGHALRCPSCRVHTFAVAAPDCRQLLNRTAWIADDEVVPCVRNVDAETVDAAVVGVVGAGRCLTCAAEHFVLDVFVGQMAIDRLLSAVFLDGLVATHRAPAVDGELHLCTGATAESPQETWILSRYDGAKGRIDRHTFGPFPIVDRGQVFGDHGICAGGPRTGNAFWTALADRVDAAASALAAVCAWEQPRQ